MNALTLTPMPATSTAADFEQLYAEYRTRVTAYVAHHLAPQRRHLAEDITAEAFLSVWVTMQNGGRPIQEPFALLTTVAKHRITDYMRLRRNHEVATDFEDTDVAVSRTLVAPLADAPHLARLFDELEAAKDQLVTAAELYKAARKAQNTARIAILGCHLPASIQRWTDAAEQAAIAVPLTLAGFKDAADLVAARRRAWNEAAETLGNHDNDPVIPRLPAPRKPTPDSTAVDHPDRKSVV